MAVTIVKPDVPSEFLVDNRVYTDPKLFDDERERLFLRVWNFVCHESEVREPGDHGRRHHPGACAGPPLPARPRKQS